MSVNCLRNKVLIAFESRPGRFTVDREEALQRIFNLDPSKAEDNIVKNLTWKTKYYQCTYDLYIDEFEDVEDWLQDLDAADYEELRAVLAGVVLVKSYNLEDPASSTLLERFARIQCPNSFLIWCNSNEVVNEDALDRANSTIACHNTNAEMVNWDPSRSVNEYGEKQGAERIREIIDTHEWVSSDSREDSTSAPSKQEEESPLAMDNLAAAIAKLQRARQHYQGLDNDGEEASSFAAAMAEEISELL